MLTIMANSILTNYQEAPTQHFQTFVARTFLVYHLTWLSQIPLSGPQLLDLGAIKKAKTLHFWTPRFHPLEGLIPLCFTSSLAP